MKALEYLNEVVANRGAFVPVELFDAVRNAAMALGFSTGGGMFDADRNEVVLYIA